MRALALLFGLSGLPTHWPRGSSPLGHPPVPELDNEMDKEVEDESIKEDASRSTIVEERVNGSKTLMILTSVVSPPCGVFNCNLIVFSTT